MRTKTVRILNIVAGILLIAAGIYCLCNEDVAVLSAGLMLGVFMLAAGIAEIVVFAGTSGVLIGSGWLLLDGVLTVIMSLFLLFNQWFTLLSLPFIFTVWLMFSGISRFVSAFDLHALGVRSWGWVLAVGILLMAAGFICMMDPWVSAAAVGVTVGLVRLYFQNERYLSCKQCQARQPLRRRASHINMQIPEIKIYWRNYYGTQHLW